MALRGERGWWPRARTTGVAGAFCMAFVLFPAGASAARHFEKVSPAEKGLGDIVGDGWTTIAAEAGDAVAFNTRTPFGDTVGSGGTGHTQYVARRTDEAWVVHAVTPTPRPDARQDVFVPTLLQLYSDDLRTAVLRGYDLPGATDDAPLRNSIYVEDTATLSLKTVTVSQVDTPTVFDFLQYPQPFWGISADARHVAFVSATQFLPNAALGVPNVYQWDDGVLNLAGLLPDGTLPSGGSDSPASYRGAMSADGSRLLFTASPDGSSPPQLYMRIGERRTAWISENELDPLDLDYQEFPANVQVMGMTPNGRSVFFTTDARLLSNDRNTNGTDLYRYTDSDNPASDSNLTLISQDGSLAGAELGGISNDGERVYYQTTTPELVVWDHGNAQVISNRVFIFGAFGLPASPGDSRVTPDGAFLAFRTNATMDDDGVHGITGEGEVTNRHYEMYLYSLRDRRVTCSSCPSGSATSDVTVLPAVTEGTPPVRNPGFRPRFLSESGHVFFSTADALVPQDTNGVLDAYEYDPVTGRVSLLSAGTGKDPATFTDASASGDNVFIVTRQRLVASDRDDLVDLYDARDGSSLPEVVEQPRLVCEGDGCQPPPSASPPGHPRGSSIFEDDSGVAAGGFRLLAVRQHMMVRGAHGLLRVRLFATGRLTWGGRGLQPGSVSRSGSGRYEVHLRLRRHARLRLRAAGVYTTSIHLTFVSAGGDEVKRTTRVTFRVVAKKGR